MCRVLRTLLVSLAIAGCGSTPETTAPVNVTINNLRWHLVVGDTFRFTASPSSEYVNWSSTAPSVLSIDRGGLAHALAPGSTSIIARVGSGSTSWALEVTHPVASLRIQPGSVDLVAGDLASPTVDPVDVTGADVTMTQNTLAEITDSVRWSVDDTTIASTTGGPAAFATIRALRAGQTSVRAHLGGITGTASVTVRELTFVDVAAGAASTCGVTTDAGVYCWGDIASYLPNATGALFVPHRVTDQGTTLVSVTVGATHACGIAPSGLAYCWGSNDYGQLGDGSADQPAGGPVAVAGGHHFAELTAGDRHTCGLASDGLTYCWGTIDGVAFNSGPELCGSEFKGVDTRSACSHVPIAVGAGSVQFTSLSAGTTHTCALDGGGATYCWGAWGSSTAPAPVPLAGPPPFGQLASGARFSCGLDLAHQAWCWGSNQDGQLGDGTLADRDTPAPVTGTFDFASISAAVPNRWTGTTGAVCALTSSHALYCWGVAVGADNSRNLTPTQVGTGYTRVAVGPTHLCALDLGSILFCWGGNDSGELGILPTGSTSTPSRVTGQRAGGP